MRRESWCRKGENCESEKAKGKNERQLFPTPLEHEVFECDEEKKTLSPPSPSSQPTATHSPIVVRSLKSGTMSGDILKERV
jgi:hypothetical protein